MPTAEMFLRDNSDPDFAAFVSIWFFEEQKHSLAMIEYLTRFAPEFAPTKEELAAVRFTIDEAPPLESLALHFCGEVRLSQWYRCAAAYHEEPVIKHIYMTLANDEARHARAYYEYMKRAIGHDAPAAALAFTKIGFLMTRAFQALLAVLGAAAGQRGPLWWADKHRRHHRHADAEGDPHSPLRQGFWHAHLGWILRAGNCDTNLDAVRDLARFPELVWINRYHYLFAYGLLAAIFALGQYTTVFGARGLGIAAMVWVFFVGTLASLHATFAVNTITHGLRGGPLHDRRFATADSTTNCWLLAVPTLGASWHNNHHRYMNAARAGFYWWQLDLGYAALRLLAALRIVWDLHEVPAAVLAEGRLGPARPHAPDP